MLQQQQQQQPQRYFYSYDPWSNFSLFLLVILLYCDICQRAKQKKLSYPTRQNFCYVPFELVHIDLWGPFSELTQEGYKYFLTIVNDHTRVT